jgi:hypothetical protein
MSLGQLSTDDVSIVRGKEDERGAVCLTTAAAALRRSKSGCVERKIPAALQLCSHNIARLDWRSDGFSPITIAGRPPRQHG